MEEINSDFSINLLRVQLNRPSKKTVMTLARYAALAEELDRTDKNDSFTAGNDIAGFTTLGYTMPTQVGYLRAGDLILLGEPSCAARATKLGLGAAVVPVQSVWDETTNVAIKLAGKPAEGLSAWKKLIKAPEQNSLRQAISVHSADSQPESGSLKQKTSSRHFSRSASRTRVERRRPERSRV